MKLYFPITVDLYNPHPLPRMNAQQHNVGRGAIITLTANGQVIVPDQETVRIFAKRPDKNVSYLDCNIVEGKIQADFTDQMLATEGNVEVELELATEETNITTPIFIVEVNKSNVKEGVESSNEYKALEKYTAEAKESAEQAQEVYDNIPNYEANLIVSKATGEVITTTDSAKVKPKNIKLFGKSAQNQYEGNQLFDASNPSTISESVYGIDDNAFLVTAKGNQGSGTYAYITYEWDISELPSATHLTFTLKGLEILGSAKPYVRVQAIDTNGENTVYTNLYEAGSVKIPLTNVQKVRLLFYSNAGNECLKGDGGRFKCIMLNEGDALPCEPFVGNAPSPSLAYPQKVTPIGEGGSIGGKVLTTNFLNIPDKTVTEKGITITAKNGVLTAKGTCTATNNANISLVGSYGSNKTIAVLYKGTYTTREITFTTYDGTTRKWYYPNTTFTVEDKMEINWICSPPYALGQVVSQTLYPRIVLDENIPFEPYSEQSLTYQTPNGLHGIPLGTTIPDVIKNSPIHMSGVYWDSVEQQYYIGNTKNEDGKDVQRILEITINSATGQDSSGKLFAVYSNSVIQNKTYAHMEIMCDCFIANTLELSGLSDYAICQYGTTIYVRNKDWTTLEEANVALQENPITIYVILAEPIITDTTEEEKAQLDALVMNYPNTTIVNDEGAYMEVEYVCDTKEHIKQNYTPNSVTEDILERLGNVESQIALNS